MAYLAIMQKKRKIPHRVELLCDIVGRQSASVPTLAFFFDDTTPNSIENVESISILRHQWTTFSNRANATCMSMAKAPTR